jgi:hypothetical protein
MPGEEPARGMVETKHFRSADVADPAVGRWIRSGLNRKPADGELL